MLQVAIIGISGYGNIHYESIMRYREKGKLKIVGATVINQDEEAEKCAQLKAINCQVFEDYRDMLNNLAGKIDVCFIPTGINTHAPMAIAAMRAGANAFIEKPIAPTIQDVRAIQEAEKRYNRFTAVGFQFCYQPQVKKIQSLINSPEFGRIKSIHGIGFGPRNNKYYGRNNWAGKIRRGNDWILDSPFNNAMAHYLHLCCLFSEPFNIPAKLDWIEAQLFKANPELECADNGCIRGLTKKGIEISFYSTHTPENECYVKILIKGEKGQIEWTPAKTIYTLEGQKKAELNTTGEQLNDCMMNALLEKVHNNNTFVCNLKLGSVHTMVVNAAHESSRIAAVPNDFIYSKGKGPEARIAIHGIDKSFLDTWETGNLLSNSQHPWLPIPERIFLDEYAVFSGCKTENKN